jgi:ATP-binding cassette subfamily B protein
MPVAFFTRAQTGALVSRLNNDVIGAQQAFTSTLSGVVGNMISLVAVVVAMLFLSWQITVASLILLPIFLVPARWIGRTLQQMTREQMQLNADMSTQMTERFNVAGALLVKLFGRPDEESADFSGKSGRVRDIGVSRWPTGLLGPHARRALATALVYGVGATPWRSRSEPAGAGCSARAPRPAGAANVRVDVMTRS